MQIEVLVIDDEKTYPTAIVLVNQLKNDEIYNITTWPIQSLKESSKDEILSFYQIIILFLSPESFINDELQEVIHYNTSAKIDHELSLGVLT
jgi:2-keto-4-pentenoate hydratase/2-oxohepta-3-ene-1,7-dioic acid hydratase in catechol pathway